MRRPLVCMTVCRSRRKMKKARKSRSKSPAKRVRFNNGAVKKGVVVTWPMSPSGYVQVFRQSLGDQRVNDYHEFVNVLSELRRSTAATDTPDDDSTTEHIISLIERAISLLDGQAELIAGLRMFLPSQYYIDVQPDAVVIKVGLHKDLK